jgi:hypothetical protein
MNTMGDRHWFQAQGAAGHTQGVQGHTQEVQTGNSTGRGKANDVVREIRQEVDDRKSNS